VLVIGQDGQQLGVMKTRTAVKIAQEEYSLDLFCVNPNGKPPVCKMMDYGKYRFDKQKKEREQKRNQKAVELKEIRMSPVIGEHDLQVRVKQAIGFLQNGDRIKISIRYRGRQLAHIDVGEKVLEKFLSYVEEYATIERAPALEGRFLTVFLAAKKK
jgi:translation initiation factor IF-3